MNTEKEDILKELHGSDSEEDEPKDQENPIVNEKERHKDNLMKDIYDQISDEEEEESEESAQIV